MTPVPATGSKEGGPAREDRARREAFRPLLVGLALAVLAAAAAALLWGTEDAHPGMDASDLGHPSLGDGDAPVVMVEYADFRCPFCGEFARDVEPRLIEEYVEDGTLRIEWRDFPYLGQRSINAALAARAAQEQGRFWEFHDLLYEEQGHQNDELSDKELFALAEKAGLDAERFEEGLKGGANEQTITQDFLEGQQRGVTATPTFYVNDEVIAGAQPIEAFEEAIEGAAREADDG